MIERERVLAAVEGHGPLTFAELTKRLRVTSRGTLQYGVDFWELQDALTALKKDGLVVEQRVGAVRQWSLP